MKNKSNRDLLLNGSIVKAILTLAIPVVINSFLQTMYNLTDTYWLGKLGTEELAAINLVTPVQNIIINFGSGITVAGSVLISQYLGAKKDEDARSMANQIFTCALIFSVVCASLCAAATPGIVTWLGAEGLTWQCGKTYLQLVILDMPFLYTVNMYTAINQAQGDTVRPMLLNLAGITLNLILDPVLIFGFNMGISGAAIATIFSQFVSFVILLVLVVRSGNVLKPSPRYFTLQGWVYKEIFSAGMPTLGRQGLASVASVLLNVAASGFGDAAVAAMSIVTRIMMFINSALIGFGQGFQPVCGFNFGAGLYERVLESYFFCRRVALVFLLVMGIVMFAISTPIMTLFRKEDPEVIRIGALALKMQCCLLPFQSYTIIGNMLTQSIGYSLRATLTAISKQGLFFIPAILILPSLLGIPGLQLAQPVADGLTFVLTQVIVVMVVKELRKMAASQNRDTE